MPANEEIENVLQYHFRDRALLKEALVAAGVDPSNGHKNTRRNGNKALALVGDALLRLVLVDDSISGGASTGLFITYILTYNLLNCR